MGRPAYDPEAVPTRQRILDAALQLFFLQSFAATSVKEITEAAQITQGALYNHFASKEDVLHALILDAVEEGAQLIDAELSAVAGEGPVAEFYAMAYASTLWYARHRAASMVAAFEYVHLDEARRDDVIKHRLAMRRRVEQIVAEGVETGDFVLPDGGRNGAKFAATAMVNLSMRATEMYGPFPALTDEAVAHFHAALAVRMLGAEPPSRP